MSTVPNLAAEVLTEAVRVVEDALDANITRTSGEWVYLEAEAGPAIVRGLLEAGWTPPAP